MTTQREIQESTVEAMVEAQCEGTMRDALTVVILPLLAKAWEEGYTQGGKDAFVRPNPYTAEAQVPRCGVHKDWSLKQTCTLSKNHLGQHKYEAQVDGL